MKRKQLLKSVYHDMFVCFSFFSRHPRSWAVASTIEGSLCLNRSRMSSLTRFCSCPRLYKYARRKQHTEMRHIAVSRPDLWQLVPRLLSVSCAGGDSGVRVSHFPYHVLLTLSSFNSTIQLDDLQIKLKHALSKFHLIWFIVFNSPCIIIIATFWDYKLNSPHGLRKFTAYLYQRDIKIVWLPTHNVSHRHPLNMVECKYFIM